MANDAPPWLLHAYRVHLKRRPPLTPLAHMAVSLDADGMHSLIDQAHRCAQQGCMDTHGTVSQYALVSLLSFCKCNLTHKSLRYCVPWLYAIACRPLVAS